MSPSSGETGALQYLSVFVVDAERDGGGVQEQPGLLLVHLLPETVHAALTLWCFLCKHTKERLEHGS